VIGVLTVLDRRSLSGMFAKLCGINSAVECQLPKLNVTGPNPVSRSIFQIVTRDFLSATNSRQLVATRLTPDFDDDGVRDSSPRNPQVDHRRRGRKFLDELLRARRCISCIVEFRGETYSLLRRELDAWIVLGTLLVRDLDDPEVVFKPDLLCGQLLDAQVKVAFDQRVALMASSASAESRSICVWFQQRVHASACPDIEHGIMNRRIPSPDQPQLWRVSFLEPLDWDRKLNPRNVLRALQDPLPQDDS
jgi:hypothetical protein